MNQDFKKALLAINLAYGLNQTEIARRLNVNRTYISSVCSGKYPFNDTLARRLELEFPDAFKIEHSKEDKNMTTNFQPIETNNGTAVNGCNNQDMIVRMQDQIDSLLGQNKQLLTIIENLTKK